MNTTRLQSAAFAVLVTVATLGSLNAIANTQHREALVASQQPTTVAVAASATQQIVIVGRRVRG
jgi:hypothetical protein